MPANEKLEELMNKYGDSIFRMCFLYLKDYHLAEDATQETFIKAMNSYDSFEHNSSEKTWLIRIAINVCKNIMRSHWFQIMKNNPDEQYENIAGNSTDYILEASTVSSAIMKLNTQDRQVITLYYYQELSAKEIAAIIGKTENTVLQRLKRARDRLKKHLMEAGYE